MIPQPEADLVWFHATTPRSATFFVLSCDDGALTHKRILIQETERLKRWHRRDRIVSARQLQGKWAVAIRALFGRLFLPVADHL
jgi:hypothetical protein